MVIKLIILLFLATILFCLGSAVVFLVKQKPGSTNLVKALTARIALSLILFFLLIIAFLLGWLKPHQLFFH